MSSLYIQKATHVSRFGETPGATAKKRLSPGRLMKM